MSTEYRRGIPSAAHVEAATRLGLEWHRESHREPHNNGFFTRFRYVDGQLRSNYTEYSKLDDFLTPVSPTERTYSYRPIRPDGTPVGWEVLDQEVARVGWRGQLATVTPTTSATQPLSHSEGFRADLFRRITSHFDLVIRDVVGDFVARIVSVRGLVDVNAVGIHADDYQWGWGTTSTPVPGPVRADILTRWTVYQELKPLYDLVDGAQGEAAMPRDVYNECRARAGWTGKADDRWLLRYNSRLEAVGIGEVWHGDGHTSFEQANMHDFATVLDAVAERRVGHRAVMALHDDSSDALGIRELDGSTGSVTVGGTLCVQTPQGVRPATQPEPRRFADVRPDRHGWRWWIIGAINSNDMLFSQAEADRRISVQNGQFYWLNRSHVFGTFGGLSVWADRTVVPTDEQGNPVSWEAIAPVGTVQSVNSDGTVTVRLNGDGSVSPARHAATESEVQRVTQAVSRVVQQASQQILGENVTVLPTGRVEPDAPAEQSAIPSFSRGHYTISPGQFSNDFAASAPITAESFARALIQLDRGQNSVNAAQLHTDTIRYCEQQISQAIIGVDTSHVTVRNSDGVGLHDSLKQQPLPRFTADELDDVDHSKTTKLDEVTLRRGKLPTVEQIAKYREVRAKRTGGAVADALKESRIDCELAQYVLERWAGGLGDDLARILYVETRYLDNKQDIDKRASWFLSQARPALDTSEKPSPTVQRERQEAEERRQRLAELRQRLAAERAVQPQEMAKESGTVSRFDLIEPDPEADPAASIRAWEARQAAAKVRPVAVSPRIAKPAAAPRRPTIEIVDAEVDGLSRSEAFAALFGRALNGGC